ncbi:MAG: GLPGLI family protein [Leeuwenhoekiella sp.]
MKTLLSLFVAFVFIALLPAETQIQEFQGEAYYFSKSKMELGSWGARMTEAQKKQIQARLKNRLEKTYVLSFNKEESVFIEEEKIDAMSGATDSWGKNFARGEQYKNVKENALVQSQEFYGKRFLVKDKLQKISWQMGSDSKQIGQYMCFKAITLIPTKELLWYDFSWSDLEETTSDASESATTTDSTIEEIPMTTVEAWYTLQIPVSHGPAEYYGLPGLILEVSAGNTTMLCSKVVMNPEEKIEISAPEKGQEITKMEYRETIQSKMLEMRNNRGRRRG